MTKRVLAFLLVVALVFSLVPSVALAEGEEPATPGYNVILQKAHNQTASYYDVDVYLQANTAEDAGDITGWQFTVNPAEGLEINNVVDNTGVAEVAGSEATFVLMDLESEEQKTFAVGTTRVLAATISLTVSESAPATVAAALSLSGITITKADGFYTDDATKATIVDEESGEPVANPEYKGNVTTSYVEYGCSDHDCGHGTGTWTGVTAADLSGKQLAAGKYYLTENVTLASAIDVAANAEVTLCLNGFNIVASTDSVKLFHLTQNASTLNICDCTATGTGADYQSGKLINKGNWGGAIRVNQGLNNTVNIYGGTFDATSNTKSDQSASLFYVNGPATFNMLGGKVVGTKGNPGAGAIILRGNKLGEVTAKIANVTFDGCANDIITADEGGTGDGKSVDNKVTLVVENVTMVNSVVGAHSVNAVDKNFKTLTIKGNCKFDAPVYVDDGDVITLDLDADAKLTVESAEDKTAATLSDILAVAEGATLPAGIVLYQNAGGYVTYENGQFKLAAGHEHEAQTYADGTAAGHTVNEMGFMLWSDPNALPTSGNWALDTDVTLPADVEANVLIAKDTVLNLDLNGHTINLNSDKRFYIEGTLNLFDCKETYDENGNWVSGGQVTGGTNKTGGAFNVRSAVAEDPRNHGVLNMYGGRVTGNGQNVSGTSGGAVYVQASLAATVDGETVYRQGAEFNMYGGELYANKSGQLGSAVTAYGYNANATSGNVGVPASEKLGATFNFHGGKIHSNINNNGTEEATSANGTIYLEYDAMFNMTGGEISNNTAEDVGGAVYANNTATATISGGLISGNTAGQKGGAFYTGKSGVVTVTGGKIQNNSADLGGAFYVGSGTQTISGGEWTGNSATTNGGAIYTVGGTTNVSKGTFSENNAANGGAVATAGGTLNITGGTWTDNTASTYGGMLWAQKGTANISNVTISGHKAERGGAIRTEGSSSSALAKVNVTNCIITGNEVRKSSKTTLTGSAISMAKNSQIKLTDTVITGNHVNANEGAWIGGAVWLESATSAKMTLAGKVVIADNTAKDQSDASKNRPLARDLVIQDTCKQPKIDVSGLTAGSNINMYNYITRDVSAVFDTSKVPETWNTGWINYYESSDTDDSTSGGNGRNLYEAADTKHLDYADDAWTWATGHKHGNVVYNEITALPTTTDDLAAYTQSADGKYYLVMTQDITYETSKYILPANIVLCLNGYDIAFTGIGFYLDNDVSLTIDDCTAHHNADGTYIAGGITSSDGDWKSTAGRAFRINNGTVNMNAGRIHDISSALTTSLACFVEDGGTAYIHFNGGEIDNVDATCTSDSTFRSGLIGIRGTGEFTMSNFTIRNCDMKFTYSKRINDMLGALMYFEETMQDDITFNNVVFENNTANIATASWTNASVASSSTPAAPDINGLIHNAADNDIEMNNTKFIGNTYTNNCVVKNTDGSKSQKGYIYGGIKMDKGNLSGTGNEFKDNVATGVAIRGNAVYLGATANLSMTNSRFINNSAEGSDVLGGQINATGSTTCNNTINFNGCTFEDNYSEKSGGVMYIGYSGTPTGTMAVTFTDCDFTRNEAATAVGGALAFNYTSSLTIEGCTFTDNKAATNGGALMVAGGNDGTVTIGGEGDKKVIFEGNTAENYGGAIYAGVNTGGGKWSNVTFNISNIECTKNDAKEGGAIFLRGDDAEYNLSDCVITGNTATNTSAMTIWENVVVNLSDSTITGNTATGFGAVCPNQSGAQVKLSGKMVIKDNICTGNGYPATTDIYFWKKAATNNAVMDMSGLTEGSEVGVMMMESRLSVEPVFTTGGSASALENGYVFANYPQRQLIAATTVTNGDVTTNELQIAKYVDANGVPYSTIQAAIEAAEAAGETTFKLQTVADETLTFTSIKVLDLNGCDVSKVKVAAGNELSLMDTATKDYDVSDSVYGQIGAIDLLKDTPAEGETAKPDGVLNTYYEFGETGKTRYVTIVEDGKTSAHRVYLSINGKLIRTANNGVGFKAIFAGDEVVTRNLTEYGINLDAGKNDADGNLIKLPAVFNNAEFVAGRPEGTTTPNQRTAVVTGVLSKEFSDEQNQTNVGTVINGVPFIQIGDVVITGKTVSTSILELGTAVADNVEATALIQAMLDKFGVELK